MRNKSLPVVVGLLVAVAACSPAKVTVAVQVSTTDPQTGKAVTVPGMEVEVRMLPFDRDSVFDSLTAAYKTPEPPIPAYVTAQRDSVRAAEQRWREAEQRWTTLRDTLQKLDTVMKQVSRSGSQYVDLFKQWTALDGQYSRVNKEKDQDFAQFTKLQQASSASADSIKVLRENWSNEAFKDVDQIFAAKAKALGKSIAVDTTTASGTGDFAVKPGKWWITARYQLPYSELYWNVPVEAERGKPLHVTLTNQNAKVRETL